jgi:hypothetical protein
MPVLCLAEKYSCVSQENRLTPREFSCILTVTLRSSSADNKGNATMPYKVIVSLAGQTVKELEFSTDADALWVARAWRRAGYDAIIKIIR